MEAKERHEQLHTLILELSKHAKRSTSSTADRATSAASLCAPGWSIASESPSDTGFLLVPDVIPYL